jgi:micrococcal nuclease
MNKWTLGSILAFLLAGGATGYTVIQDRDVDIFESSIHQVQYVVDGDTLDLENEVRVRLIGIDTPERTECGYAEAREFLVELVDKQPVRIEKDISGADIYGRLLRYVYLPSDTSQADDVLVNESLLRAGHARTLAIAPDNRYRDLFASAQDEAKRAGRGMWGACDMYQTPQERQADSQPTDPACIIKGNISAKSFGRTYFVPGCPNYNRVKVDINKGEQYFCSEAEAQAAGFERSGACAKTFSI